jgi:hypothetical protein
MGSGNGFCSLCHHRQIATKTLKCLNQRHWGPDQIPLVTGPVLNLAEPERFFLLKCLSTNKITAWEGRSLQEIVVAAVDLEHFSNSRGVMKVL